MAAVRESMDLELKRMELRGVVRLAWEVIAQYWPMRTFVHHNPLHSSEYLPFEETVRRGKQFLSGDGYLPSHLHRATSPPVESTSSIWILPCSCRHATDRSSLGRGRSRMWKCCEPA